MERRYTTGDAAAIIGISPRTLRNLISKQRLGRPTKHAHLAYEYVGSLLVFRESVLKAWIEAEHQRGQHSYERRRTIMNPDTDPRYVKLEDWDGRGYRCEHCGLVRWWKYEMKNHLAYRNNRGRCQIPPSLETEKKRAAHLGKKKKRGRPKGSKNKRRKAGKKEKMATSRKPKRKQKRKAKPKKRPKRVRDWKKLPISVKEGWDKDDYLGT